MSKLLFLDVETTGVDKKVNALHQLSGCVVIDNVVIECFDYKIRPFDGAIIEQEALDVCHLSKETLFGEDYLPESEVFAAFSVICNKYINKFNKQDKFFLVGYNVHFDKDFMYEFFMRNHDKYFFSFVWGNHLDVMVLAAHKLMDKRPQMKDFKQGTVAKFVGFEVNEESLHNSLYDIFICLGLYCYLTDEKFEQTEMLIVNKNEEAMVLNYAKPVNFLEQEFKTIIRFGKYKNSTIGDIAESDAGYLCWVYENMKNQYTVTSEMYTYCLKLRSEQEEFRNSQKTICSQREETTADYFHNSADAMDLDCAY